MQYNYLSDHQQQVRDKELADCPNATCRLATSLKWEAASLQQDLGLAVGVGGGMGLSVADTAQGLYELGTHFSEVKEVLNQLRDSPEFRQQFSDAYLSSLEQRANLLTQAYNDAGWEGSVTAGVLAGQFASDLVGVLTAVRGAAAITAKLPEATVKLLNAVAEGPVSGGMRSQLGAVGDLSNISPLGRGSTGRSTPKSLKEQLALNQAISEASSGRVLPVPMTDPRWPSSDGWVKMAQNINGIEIHYVRNTVTGAIDDFKFK